MILTLPKDHIQKFLLEIQMLLEPREISGYEGIETVITKLGSIQYDPQNICGPSVDLTLQARISNISIFDYFEWLYDDNKGIEVFDKELCIIPISEIINKPKYYSIRRKNKLNKFIEENRVKLDEILAFVKNYGPVCSNDFIENQKVEIGWAPVRWSKYALDNLWKNGELVIEYRKNNRKFFNLPYNVYGNAYDFPRNIQLNETHIKKRINCVGLLPKSGTGSGWLGVGIGKEINPIISRMLNNNELIEIRINGSSDVYVINYENLPLLENIKDKTFTPKMSFLSPLDNLLWDRKMIANIFEFNYKWEAYTPKHERKYGHYALPILYGNVFIGRIEPKINRKDEILEIVGLWFEKDFKPNKHVRESFDHYMEHMIRFTRTKDFIWKCKNPFKV